MSDMSRIAAHLRGFQGPALFTPEIDGAEPRNDFLAAMRRLSALPDDVDARGKLQQSAQHDSAAIYGEPTRAEKPYSQVGDAAVIPVSGVLVNRFGGSYGWVTGYNAIRSQLNFALGDPSVTRIVLDVNSYGGMVQGCFELAADVRAARDVKPILAVVDGACCSAAYAIASQATKIAAAPSAMVGSIGVVSMHVSYEKMMADAGIEVTFITAGKFKAEGNPYEKLSPEAKAQWQARVDAIYDTFAESVAEGRKGKLTAKAAKETEARVYSSGDALALGMIDAVSMPQAALSGFAGGGESPEQERATDMSETSEAIAAARAAERTRISGITGHAEAAGRGKLAMHLATNTDLSVEAAGAILAVAPKEAAEAPKPAERDRLGAAMDSIEQPNVGGDGGKDKSEDRVGAMLAAWSQATGTPLKAN